MGISDDATIQPVILRLPTHRRKPSGLQVKEGAGVVR
jgi:hypothetical protein